MSWDGIRRDTASVDGAGLEDALNVSYYVDGELRRRPGLANRGAGGFISMASFRDTRDNNANWIIGQTVSGVIQSTQIDQSSATTLTTLAAATSPGSFAQFNGVLYFYHPDADGVAIQSGDDAAQVSTIGVPAPVAAMGEPTKATGATSIGRHILRYRFYNSALGYFGNPSDPVTVDVAGANEGQLTFTVAAFGGSADIVGSNNTRVDKIIIEMTLVGGDQFYDVAMINNGSTSDLVISMDDATLEQQQRRAFGLSVGAASPPRFGHVTVHGGRMFGLRADNPFVLEWSSPGQPEGFDSTSNSRRVFGNTGDVPVALFSVFEDLYIFGQRSVAKLRYNTNPGLGTLDVVDRSGYGLWSKHCLVEADGIAYGFGRNGIWTIPAGVPRRISRPVDDIIRTGLNESRAEFFHGSFDPVERTISWWYVATGDQYPSQCITYDIDRKTWSRRTYLKELRSSVVAAQSDGSIVSVVSDDSYVWAQAIGVFDGVPSGDRAVYLSDTGSTTTVINVTQTIPNSLLGAVAYFPKTDESRVITNSALLSITLASALSAAPAADDEIWIGPITTEVLFKWSSANGMRNKSRPRKFEISMISTAGDEVGAFRMYRDFSNTPYVYTTGVDDLFASGVTVVNGESAVTFDVDGGSNSDGFLSIPIPSDWSRVIRSKVSFTKPQGQIRLLDMRFTAADSDSAAVTDE